MSMLVEFRHPTLERGPPGAHLGQFMTRRSARPADSDLGKTMFHAVACTELPSFVLPKGFHRMRLVIDADLRLPISVALQAGKISDLPLALSLMLLESSAHIAPPDVHAKCEVRILPHHL